MLKVVNLSDDFLFFNIFTLLVLLQKMQGIQFNECQEMLDLCASVVLKLNLLVLTFEQGLCRYKNTYKRSHCHSMHVKDPQNVCVIPGMISPHGRSLCTVFFTDE